MIQPRNFVPLTQIFLYLKLSTGFTLSGIPTHPIKINKNTIDSFFISFLLSIKPNSDINQALLLHATKRSHLWIHDCLPELQIFEGQKVSELPTITTNRNFKIQVALLD
jgi:hypothetical protein